WDVRMHLHDMIRNQVVRKETVRVKNLDPIIGFEYYTNVEKTYVIYEMVHGPACVHRQPSGWAGEIDRFRELVAHAYYAKMSRSPFIFFSCELMHVVGELKDLLLNLIGARMLGKL